MPPSSQPQPKAASRGLRLILGLVLFGLCLALALGSFFLPYMTIQSGGRTWPVLGPDQTGNLHLVLSATGALGALAALRYAFSTRPMPVTFFVVGGIALALSGFLGLDTHHSVKEGWIRDPLIYAAIAEKGAKLSLGSALYLSLASAAAILLGAVAVLLADRAASLAPPPPPRRARF
ncbi:MAG: hypothetical protein RBU30_08040 [Polyangia bacterium]|jgi:hypothetical protein|nr:hypothetical protein [Polyangia bacterium]